eukprot:s590_g4.t1
MAYLFNPPKRCSAEWETEDSLCEVATGHAAEGANSRAHSAADAVYIHPTFSFVHVVIYFHLTCWHETASSRLRQPNVQ